MKTSNARTGSRIDPQVSWAVMTDAPLKGMGLAREAGAVLAWDEADQLYRINSRGEFQSVARAPGRIVTATISDDGSIVGVLGEGSRLWIMDGDFTVQHDRTTIGDPLSLTVDPHGRYFAVGSKLNVVQFYTNHGKSAGRIETRQPLSSVVFVPGQPFLIGIGAYGSIAGIELFPKGTTGHLDGETIWYEALMSGVGRLASTGDGAMILVSCFTHGVQRHNLAGKSEGSYHLGGSASQAVPDFSGRVIAVATSEGELAILSGTGNIRWRTTMPHPATHLETDALGRFVIHGQTTGEVVRLDLQPSESTTSPASTRAATATPRGSGSASVRQPAWTVDLVANEDMAEVAVLAVTDSPTRIGVVTSKNRLELFAGDGKRLGQAPEIDGVGRIVRTAPGWMAAATDRRLVLCDLKQNTAQRVDISLTELTHLAIHPASYGLAIVQERDRIGRATTSGRWIWRSELDSPVEDLAIRLDGSTAVTTEDGRLRVFDPAGQPLAGFRGTAADPALLQPAHPDAAVAWYTLARRSQTLRGHDETGQVVWSEMIPWEAWQFAVVGSQIVAVAADGRGVAHSTGGQLLASGRTDGPADAFMVGKQGQCLRVNRRGVHLICADLAGRVAWRYVASAPLGPLAVSESGLAIFIGKALAWFPAEGRT